MEIILRTSSNKPIYEQIYSQIRNMIMSGELQEGDTIPSMRSLAKSIHVSVITVQKAYEILAREGFIDMVVGRGSVVTAQNKAFLKEEKLKEIQNYLGLSVELAKENDISIEKLKEIITIFFEEGKDEWNPFYP